MNKELIALLNSQKCKKCNEPTKVTNEKPYKVNGVHITKYELTCPDGHKNYLEIKV